MIRYGVCCKYFFIYLIEAGVLSGINRHFQMIFLHDKLNSAVDKKVSSKDIWNHLKEMYDLAALVN
jgi:hypothetical protein